MVFVAALLTFGVGFTCTTTTFEYSSRHGGDDVTRRYHVVTIVGPGWYVSVFAPVIFENPAAALVVLICHW
jgi:hypothetical protein